MSKKWRIDSYILQGTHIISVDGKNYINYKNITNIVKAINVVIR